MQTQQAAPTPSVAVELDARETHWHVAADLAVPGCGLQWGDPGSHHRGLRGRHARRPLQNSLPEPTTIHRQGLRVPAAMDGTEMIQHPMTLRASAS